MKETTVIKDWTGSSSKESAVSNEKLDDTELRLRSMRMAVDFQGRLSNSNELMDLANRIYSFITS